MGTALKFSTTYHPQTEAINRSLGDLLQCLVGEQMTTWDEILLVAKFAYNNSVYRSTGLSSFVVVTRYRPKKLIDLLPMYLGDCPSASVG